MIPGCVFISISFRNIIEDVFRLHCAVSAMIENKKKIEEGDGKGAADLSGSSSRVPSLKPASGARFHRNIEGPQERAVEGEGRDGPGEEVVHAHQDGQAE